MKGHRSRRRDFITSAYSQSRAASDLRLGGNEMAILGRRSFLKSATLLTAGGIVTSSAMVPAGPSFGQGVPGNSQYGVKALFFDMFGTVLDWRTGVARSAEAILKPRGYSLDWLAFADAWRAQYQPGMEEVRSGRIPYTKLDVLHRRRGF
jgi:2-haloacid dehalogenase